MTPVVLLLALLGVVSGAPSRGSGVVEDPAGSDDLVIEGVHETDAEESAEEPARASEPDDERFAGVEDGELFVEANRRYEDGEYGMAVEGYRELVARGLGSAAVLYNLGNAQLRDGQLGSAIASYRRAELLSPRDQDLEANLRFARASARDALEPPRPGAIRRTLFFWHYSLSASESLRLAILCSAAVFGALSLMLRRRGSEPLRWMVIVGGVVLIATLSSLLARWAFPLRVAVVLPQEVEAFSGTDAETVVRFRLHAGTEVRAAESAGEWVRIVLPSGEQGWVESDQVELVRALR